jgi:hypothetical protein
MKNKRRRRITMVTKVANAPRQEAESTLQNSEQFTEIKQCMQDVHIKAKETGTYMAALWLTGTTVPVFAAFMSVLLYLTLFSWSPFIAAVGGSLFVLLCWFLLARLYQGFTGVDRANAASYEQLLNRLQQTVAWYEILHQKSPPPKNSLYTIAMQEIHTSIKAICKSLQTPGLSWISATGYVSVWKLMHRIDEAFIEIEPIEAVIHNALHDEMSLEDSMLPNKDDLLNKLRRAVVMLDQGASIYLNQQPPQAIRPPIPNEVNPKANEQATSHSGAQHEPFSITIDPTIEDNQTKHPDLQATPPTILNTVNPKANEQATSHNDAQHEPFSNIIDPITQARTIIYEVRTTLHHFRDDRWDKLIRVRNQLMKMTLVTGLLLFALVEFAIVTNGGVEMIKAATIFFFVGGLVGLFSRLYDQSQTDTSIDDFRLATARLIAAPLFCGLAAIGGVLVIQKDLVLSVPNLLMAAAFGLTPSLFTNAIQKQADQYKTDLKSTAATSGEKQEKQKKS